MASRLCPFCMQMTEGDTCHHCGNQTDYSGQPMHLPAGYVVSGEHPYVLGAALGQGGFGITYIALDMDTRERVAIKEYFPTYCSGRTDHNAVIAYQNQEEIYLKGRSRFLDEARTLKSLSDLNNIVNVLDFFEANNTAYLVMEFLDGDSLKEHATKHGKFPAQQFLKQIEPLMEDIHRMHGRGVIHRDIAPDNIILQPDGQMKLIDFGAARSYLGGKSMTVVVKKGFAPVEQYFSTGSTACSDVYALAATIYYCITGVVPPDSVQRQNEGIPLATPISLGADITPKQETALLNSLEVWQKKRTQNIQQFICDLNITSSGATNNDHSEKNISDIRKSWFSQKQKTIKRISKRIHHRHKKIAKTVANTLFEKRKNLLIICSVLICVIVGGSLTQMITSRKSETISTNEIMQKRPDEQQVPATVSPIFETAATEAGTEPIGNMRNVLMADSNVDLKSNLDNKVLGGDIIRSRIGTITFLTTLENAPDTSWDVSAAKDGSVLAWTEYTRDTGFGDYDLYIGAEGGVIAPDNCDYLFAQYQYLFSINFNDAFNTENVTTMKGMFTLCETMTTLDLHSFQTGKVTDMSRMFACNKTYGENGWAGVSSLASLDISGFDTSAVTNMASMFANCSQLIELDVSGFDTSNVSDMSSMFSSCSRLIELDVSGFDTSNVSDMAAMFDDCNGLTVLDVSGFNTENVIDMNQMFHGCYKLTKLDVTNFDTSNVTNMRGMFWCCHRLKSLDVSSFDTSLVTHMGVMFSCCRALTELDLSRFATSNVTDMGSMFADSAYLQKLDLAGFDTSNVTDMKKMFWGCKKLKNLTVGEFNTSNVEEYESFMEDGKTFNGRPWQELFQ